MTDYIAEAIEEAWGERCHDVHPECHCCRAWKQYDDMKAMEEQRDNLWMAYLHSKQCFHGSLRSTNPDQCALRDVEGALAGYGPFNQRALDDAKKDGRLSELARYLEKENAA